MIFNAYLQNLKILMILAIVVMAGAFFFLKQPQSELSILPQTKSEAPKKAKPAYVEGDVLVKFKPNTPERIRLHFKETLKVKKEEHISSIDVYHWQGAFDTKQAIEVLTKSNHILYAEPNYTVQTQTAP